MSENQQNPNDQESFIPLTKHLDNLPVTKISPVESSFPDEKITENKEEKFNQICKRINGHIQVLPKKDIEWSKRDPLHFFQSLAFVLRSESLPSIAVSSFKNLQNETKLYIASNKTMTESQQNEITEIINLFLEKKSAEEIIAKVIPHQLSCLIKEFIKGSSCLREFIEYYPGELASKVKELMYITLFERSLTLDEIHSLMKLIWKNKMELDLMKSVKRDNAKDEAKLMAYHLCKMARMFNEIIYVLRKVERHQKDPSLALLSKSFEFIENKSNCHAEIALLKTAKDVCKSKTLYIGVSKRPCYCCSLFFKAIEEFRSVNFNISIAPTNGKLYNEWNKIEGFFFKEFCQVWAMVVQKRAIIDRAFPQMATDDNSSVSGSSSGEDVPKLSALATRRSKTRRSDPQERDTK